MRPVSRHEFRGGPACWRAARQQGLQQQQQSTDSGHPAKLQQHGPPGGLVILAVEQLTLTKLRNGTHAHTSQHTAQAGTRRGHDWHLGWQYS